MYFNVQVIQVDFEGRNPMTSDFHGIRQLMHQLFLKSDINLSELTDIVTGMNRVYRFVHHAITHHVWTTHCSSICLHVKNGKLYDREW